ncbi:hypothetical protein AB4254_09265 [Vibrio breoganii]
MKKIILFILAGLLAVGGAFFAGTYFTGFSSKPVVLEEPKLHEVDMNGIILTINHSGAQSLLYLDLTFIIYEDVVEIIENNQSVIKNRMLTSISQNPKAYFYEPEFIMNLQSDLKQSLSKIKGFELEDLLVTKAVFQ